MTPHSGEFERLRAGSGHEPGGDGDLVDDDARPRCGRKGRGGRVGPGRRAEGGARPSSPHRTAGWRSRRSRTRRSRAAGPATSSRGTIGSLLAQQPRAVRRGPARRLPPRRSPATRPGAARRLRACSPRTCRSRSRWPASGSPVIAERKASSGRLGFGLLRAGRRRRRGPDETAEPVAPGRGCGGRRSAPDLTATGDRPADRGPPGRGRPSAAAAGRPGSRSTSRRSRATSPRSGRWPAGSRRCPSSRPTPTATGWSRSPGRSRRPASRRSASRRSTRRVVLREAGIDGARARPLPDPGRRGAARGRLGVAVAVAAASPALEALARGGRGGRRRRRTSRSSSRSRPGSGAAGRRPRTWSRSPSAILDGRRDAQRRLDATSRRRRWPRSRPSRFERFEAALAALRGGRASRVPRRHLAASAAILLGERAALRRRAARADRRTA